MMVKEGYKNIQLGPRDFKIPECWDKAMISKVCENLDRMREPVKSSNRERGDIPYYGATGCIDYVNDYIFNEKLVLIGEDGADWSKFANTAYIIDGKSWVNNHAHVLRCKDIDEKYLSEIINYLDLNYIIVGTNRGKLNKGALMDLDVLYPPQKEQKKIAAILSSVDENIEKTERTIEKTKELKKGLMQQLLTKGIGHDEFKEVKIGPKKIEIPKTWNVNKFQDVSNVNQGLQIAISERKKKPGKNRLKYITVQHLNNPKDNRYTYYVENPRDSVVCDKNDILMTRTGNTGEVITNILGVFHNNFFKVDFDRELLNKDFLFYYLNSRNIQHVIKIFAGTTTIPDLNHGDFYSIPVLIPPLEEQKKIANILSTVEEKVQKEEEYKAKLERLKKGLMQKLLTGEIRVNVDDIKEA